MVAKSMGENRTFKVGDKVQTRDGRPARIIADDVKHRWSLVVLVAESESEESLQTSLSDGRLNEDHETRHDLVPLPQKLHVWGRGGRPNTGPQSRYAPDGGWRKSGP